MTTALLEEAPPVTSGDGTLTRAETAERLGVSERTVNRYVERDLLTARRNPITRRVSFDVDEVDALRRARDGA